MTSRKNSYDLLRIISAFAVILIHVNATITANANISLLNWTLGSFINTITRFSVPCFVMLSGALLLNNKKNANYSYFYRKSFYKIGIPLCVFTLLSLLFSICTALIKNDSLIDVIKPYFLGYYNNYWFMFMLIGLYFLVPIIIRVKETVKFRTYCIFSFVWMIFACINLATSGYTVAYSFGIIFSFVSYFVLGDIIFEKKERIKHPCAWILISLLLFVLEFIIRNYFNISSYLTDPHSSWFSPIVVLASLFLFMGFSNINIESNFSKLSSWTYIIYLAHTNIYLLLVLVAKFSSVLQIHSYLNICVVSILTFILSCIVSVVYNLIWKRIETKYKLKEKFLKKSI